MGRVVLIVQVKLAGVGSVLLSSSIALTLKVCELSAKLLKLIGLVQAEKLLPSNKHSKAKLAGDVRLSVPVNSKVAELLLLGLAGEIVMLVFGGMVLGGGSRVVKLHVELVTKGLLPSSTVTYHSYSVVPSKSGQIMLVLLPEGTLVFVPIS